MNVYNLVNQLSSEFKCGLMRRLLGLEILVLDVFLNTE